MKGITANELAHSLSVPYKILGDPDRRVLTPSPIDKATPDSLSFCSAEVGEALGIIETSQAGIIICAEKVRFTESDYRNRTIIQVTNPRLTFIMLLQRFFTTPPNYSIHPTAIIDPLAKISDRVSIGPYSYIGECRIGEETIIYGNVYIYPGTRIGKRVTILPGAVIGGDGYGFERNEAGKLERFPQMGGVVIGDDVEIGANTCIDRGTLDNTTIGDGTKIDNLCHIAHNVQIGKHCMIIAQSMIGGSSKIDDYSHISPSASLNNKIKVGKNVLVGLGSVVTESIPDNSVVAGVPAKPIRKNS